jgi:hypothetical protein
MRFARILPIWGHRQFLVRILTVWAERVESGDWVVTEDGVTTGMGKFKGADMPDH